MINRGREGNRGDRGKEGTVLKREEKKEILLIIIIIIIIIILIIIIIIIINCYCLGRRFTSAATSFLSKSSSAFISFSLVAVPVFNQ